MPIPILFVTYYRLVPTGQIGIFKRCLRFIERLPDDFEVHLVNFGPLPENDALFERIRQRICIHFPAPGNPRVALTEVCQKSQAKVVIIGETPMSGMMRSANKVAASLGLFRVVIENYYEDAIRYSIGTYWGDVERWLMLGLLEHRQPRATIRNIEVVPPLIRYPPGFPNLKRDRISIIGYDKLTLREGMHLLTRLPPDLKVDVFTVPEWEGLANELVGEQAQPIQIMVLPSDDAIYDSMARAKFLYGKAGYQQVVEGIALGARVICQNCGGGLEARMLPAYIRPWVRFVDGRKSFNEIMFDLMIWLGESPTPWLVPTQTPDPVGLAAERLADLIRVGVSADRE